MSFDNLIKIIDGTLLNSPSISKFEAIETNAKKTKWGDLFIAINKEDIDLALQNGAYGVLCDYDTPIKDDEIAWIRVLDIKESLKKLLRFKLLKKSLNFLYLTPIEKEIAKSITKKSDILFLEQDLIENFKKLINADENSIIISTDKEILKDIYPSFKSLQKEKFNKIQIIYKTLFFTSFIHNDKYYENLKFPPIYINELSKVLSFLQKHEVPYNLNYVKLENHFREIFITDKFKIRNFGESEHVIIVEDSNDKVDRALSYIRENAPWANSTKITLDKLTDLNIDKFNFILIKANYNKVIKFLEKFSLKIDNSLFMEL
jgi:ferrochelatase